MTLSQDDRSELISRVERRLGARGVSRAAIQEAVDRVLAQLALPDESIGEPHSLFALTAQSMPDLASRVRQKLSAAGISPTDSGTATSGRHTVMTLRVHSASRSRLESVARDVGATLTAIDDVAVAGSDA